MRSSSASDLLCFAKFCACTSRMHRSPHCRQSSVFKPAATGLNVKACSLNSQVLTSVLNFHLTCHVSCRRSVNMANAVEQAYIPS
jgi:hypothetical protein